MVIPALWRKLLRDITHLSGQILTIALVVASGVACYVALQTAWVSLSISRDAYQQEYDLADVFARCRRAPERLAAAIADIPGVELVYTRVVGRAFLPLLNDPQPVTATLVSIPDDSPPPLNGIRLSSGVFPEAGRSQVLLLEHYARAQDLHAGDTFEAIVGGNRTEFVISGLALSPEYILPMAEGDNAPDEDRFAIVWVPRSDLAALLGLQGAFNDVVLRVDPTTPIVTVIEALDPLLDPWGSVGANGQKDHLSVRALNNELMQLKAMATVVPMIFLGVSAFLLNVMMSRLIRLQRSQIASLKALGYGNTALVLHYSGVLVVIIAVGSVMGSALGAWLGRLMLNLYGDFFRFPSLTWVTGWGVMAQASLLSLVSGAAGAWGSLRQAVSLPPAEAMRPESPGVYHDGWWQKWLSLMAGPSVMMVLREQLRRPIRTALTIVTLAAAAAIMVLGRYSYEAFGRMMELQGTFAWREDMAITLSDPIAASDLESWRTWEGVQGMELHRVQGVRLHAGAFTRDAALTVVPDPSELRGIVDIEGQLQPMREGGLLMTSVMAELLHVEVGDMVGIELLAMDRDLVALPVVGFVEEPFGLNAYVTAPTWWARQDEAPAYNLVVMKVDPGALDAVQARLLEIPRVAGILRKRDFFARFDEDMGGMMLWMTLILSLGATVIGVGVVYNHARISLAVRSRDLASLRVLGYTQSEVARLFHTEMALQILIATPVGLWMGHQLSAWLGTLVPAEIFRFPEVRSWQTSLAAAGILIVAGVLSGWLMRSRLLALDMIGALKARD
jgi:putative ABC transport system permease protein